MNFQTNYLHTAGDVRDSSSLRQLYEISDRDLEEIKSLEPLMLPQMDKMVDGFYRWLMEQPEYEQFFSDPKLLKHTQKMQRIYWEKFLAGKVDDEYVEHRRVIGETHARIGLSMTMFFAGMTIFNNLVSEIIQEKGTNAKNKVTTADAVAKVIHLDTGIVCEVYSIMSNEMISVQSKSLMEMSTPVTQVWDDILLLPLVGIVDSKRALDIRNAVLSAISRTRARVFILDISGVAVVDTAVANHLIKIAKATRLMGCESTLSGISPAIAETIIELGIDTGTLKTTATMMDALEGAFQRLGLRITKTH
ncbi:anti-anti-sigma regulatory factor (antagonist of anti-sigma factor) [Cylindrospermum stagnale PCC 7417]|uniref:Anti-anti-sigma regulatory factor (Antagonist of anti-sigma factor) n=1 Tax=Cylindrospermum stagnale PCC 7417 TaxID=56107 RepID=K9X0M5_9NOST|nr:protoglobin domain-containing protein [Cylindrospermum stagnale]AFZ26165.1 anti-anti-sigma regulatory factor (antagonist of anti-sigma factor) [Cylindrospermum stagnale PCC 7417]